MLGLAEEARNKMNAVKITLMDELRNSVISERYGVEEGVVTKI